MSRFGEAISEGDGISVIPLLEGDVEGLAELAEAAGAEAIAVEAADVARVRARTGLPIIARGGDLRAVAAAGADAWLLTFAPAEEDVLAEHFALAGELDLDCVVGVRDEEALEDALRQVDPDILLISEQELEDEEEQLERALELLPDVPAGKLVIAEARIAGRAQALAFEGAGVDAVLVGPLQDALDVVVAELTGRVSRPD